MLAEAVWQEHNRSMSKESGMGVRLKKKRR
jgi:hypothetical protein